ncbi:MAG: GH92 family glycosyl hydrolase [Kiritimatiellae bacterium]|nr:GH92 family glycosyl hydrolase [Kiritimatiellia bacterium]
MTMIMDCLFMKLGFWMVAAAALNVSAAQTVWQIGTKDGTGNEFALAPSGFADFLEKDFGWDDKSFLVGRSDVKRDFPYVLPGVNDAWAGSGGGPGRRTQQVNILFDLKKVGGGSPWTLLIDFADVHHRSPPLVKVTVNGKARKIALPKGGGDESIKKGDFSKAKPFTVKLDLDGGEIREGANEIGITSIEGSWAIFDDVRLEGPEDAMLRRAHKGVYVRSVRAGDYLIPGTGQQPLLVAVEHLDGTPALRVEIDGKTALEERAESGAYVFEAPMDAVDAEKVSSYRVFVDGVCVREGNVTRSPQRDAGVAGYVDTRMGTAHSRWMLAPGPWTPFSMVKLSPDNEGLPGKRTWQGGYDPSVESVGSFSHIHEWTMAGLGTMPTAGPLCTTMGPASEIEGHAGGYRSFIDKASEVCKVGYYAVTLTDHDIFAELTATDRCGFQRYTYPAGKTPRVMIDLLTACEYNVTLKRCMIRKVGGNRIEGFSHQQSNAYRSLQDYTLHFVIEFDRPIATFAGWTDAGAWAGERHEAEDPKAFGAYVEFAPAQGRGTVLQMRTAISYVDAAGASLNLETEITKPFGWDFGKVRAANERIWNDHLGRVKIVCRDAREKKRFYTNMYRNLCRNMFNDVDGRWTDAMGRVQKLADPEERALGCDAFWNTFWNLNQSWNLIWPEWSARWMKSQMAMYDSCGWLAKGPAGMKYISVMVAEHEIPLMVGAWQMGIRACDPKRMMEAFTKMETTPEAVINSGRAGNRDIEAFLQHHYVPSDKGRFSNSMEYAFDNWTVAQFAKAIGDEAAYTTFSERGEWWKNAVNPESGYCHRRDSKGEWEKDFSPFSGSGYVEGNGWQLTYFVPQDVPALVERIGRDRFLERLTWGFEKSCPFRYNAPGENYAKFPVVQGNQQSMHFAFLFNWAKEPWNTQKWARSILERYYGYGDATAWLGDEDQGQMSAWFVMAALGLFQTDGGCRVDPVYEIASPLYEEAVIDLGKRFGRGDTFTIKAHNASRANKYVQKAIFNGKPHTTFLIDARDVLKGGTLELWMGPEPNRMWGLVE